MYEICVRFFQINRRDLVYLKFILEAYEGLSTLSTVDQSNGIVQLSYPACFTDDVTNLVSALAHDIPITEVSRPAPGLKESFCHA